MQAIVRGLLALVFPGLQAALAGRWRLAWGVSLALALPSIAVPGLGSWMGNAFLPVLGVVLALSALARVAQAIVVRPRGVRPSWWLVIGWLIASEVPLRVLRLPLRAAVAEPYMIPTSAMSPTLAAGDHLFVFKVGPASHFGRGSIVTYRERSGPVLLKRLIGLPGDGFVEVNGVALNHGPCTTDVPGEPMLQTPTCAIESLDGRAWKTFRAEQHVVDGTWLVPEGAAFVLGDYRDNSDDSRFSGFVDVSDITGTAHQIHWSSTGASPRWGRIGRSIDSLE